MSFLSDTKYQIVKNKDKNNCCKAAMLYGFLLFCKALNADLIELQTESEPVSRIFAELLAGTAGVFADIKIGSRRKSVSNKVYYVNVPDSRDRQKIIEKFCPSREKINRELLENECCVKSFVKSAFLTVGSMTDPKKDYHLEFLVHNSELSDDFSVLLSEMLAVPKINIKKSGIVLYYKESEQIEDLLTLMGAVNSSIELMNIKIYRDIRNTVNRQTNCLTANLDKTIRASSDQINAIKLIKNTRGIGFLPEELRELAEFRLENEDLSLRELGEQLHLSRSGINHRLTKIIEIAEEIKRESDV